MGAAVEQVLDVSAWVSGFDGVDASSCRRSARARLAAVQLALLRRDPAGLVAALARRSLPAGAGLALAAAPARSTSSSIATGRARPSAGRSGRLVLVGKPSAFVVEQWLRADGDGRAADDADLRQDARCDRVGCVVDDARTAAASPSCSDVAAFEEDCRRAAIVITRLAAPPACARRAWSSTGDGACSERGATTRCASTARRRDPALGRARAAPHRRRSARPRPVAGAAADASDRAASAPRPTASTCRTRTRSQ